MGNQQVAFSDERILDLIGVYFGQSSPGDEMHHAIFAYPSQTALGVPDLGIDVLAIAPVAAEERTDTFIARSITARAVESGKPPNYLVVLTMETHHVALPVGADEAAENRLRRMHADRRVQDHELAVEETLLYAACRDGRRWWGSHSLTGPDAGRVDGPHLAPAGSRVESERWMPHARLIRRAVGIAW